MSLGIGPDLKQLQYAAAGSSWGSLGQNNPWANQGQQIPKEDMDIFSASKIGGAEGVNGASFGGNVTKAIQGAVDGLSGLFGGMSERLAQFDKGQLNHPEQRSEEVGQKLWELC